MNYLEACKILGVSYDDDLNLIKKSYRSRIKFYHPDNFQGNEEKLKYADEMTKRINEAWEYIQSNYQTRNCREENTDNIKYENQGDFVCQYQYPIYEPIFTKTVMTVIIVILCLVSLLIFEKVMSPTFERWELQKKYSIEDIELLQDFEFVHIDNGYELDTLHSDFSGTVIIPETFDGEIIVAIARGAFENCEYLTEIIISENITTIGRSAFHNCDSLRSVRIPDSVTEIAKSDLLFNGVFEDCDNLQSVYIGKGINLLSSKMFADCRSLKEIYLQTNIEEIEAYTFSACQNITNIYFDGTVEQWQEINIDNNAFDPDTSFSIVCTDGCIVYPVEEQVN